ncbi:MAG TPA: heme o synthase [Streptosporangiaceae bacterium]
MTPATDALPAIAGRRPARVVARSLFALTKPRIIELLLVTTIPTMLLAQRGLPPVRVLLVTLVAGACAAGSANTINCYIDRDIDAIMRRTSRRPLNGKGREAALIKPAEALVFGILLGALSTILLGFLVNWLSAILADTAILFYVFVYTLGLKRRTPSNIVIGGAAGCFPVLIGWSAVTGRVSLPAVVLFAVIFFWTPPHFWALAMKFRDDYAAAGVPMLPVVASPAVVARKILMYSYVMVLATLALAPYAGWLYTAAALVLGGWFLVEAHRLHHRVAAMTFGDGPAFPGVARRAPEGASFAPAAGGNVAVATPVLVETVTDAPAGQPAASGVAEGACAGLAQPSSNPAPMRLFHLSIAYLTLLFAVIAVTALLPWGSW